MPLMKRRSTSQQQNLRTVVLAKFRFLMRSEEVWIGDVLNDARIGVAKMG